MKKRPGRTATFGISVDEETRRILKTEADRRYGGNVSALVAAMAREARRRAAFEWILRWSNVPRMTDEERQALREDLSGETARKKKPRAA